MPKKILLTSFDIWLPHHQSNASDDLLQEIEQQNFLDPNFLLRKLPVDIEIASAQVINKIKELPPDIIICCGMAEKNLKMMVESTATCGEQTLKTQVNLEKLVTDLSITEISHDAGKFVCEGLYFSVLNYLRDSHPQIPCIFLHIPPLNPDNLDAMITDFQTIVNKMISE